MEDCKCGFCHTGEDTESICGILHKDKIEGKTIVAHHKCMQYSAMLVQYKFKEFGGFKKQEVLKEINRGNRLACFLCKKEKSKKKHGAASGCSLSSCRKTFHYYCVSMNPHTVAKRYKVEAGKKVVILYRVFCSKAHEETYRQNISAEDIVGRNNSEDEDDDEREDEADDEDNQGDGADSLGRTAPENKKRGDKDDHEEPEKKKRKTDNEAQDGEDDDDDNSDNDDPDSPVMTQQEVILETQRQYRALQKDQIAKGLPFLHQSSSYRSDVPTSPQAPNDMNQMYDSADDMTESFNTSNNCSPEDSDTCRSDVSNFTSERHLQDEPAYTPIGCTLVIPSKLDVDIKAVCQAMGLQPASCLFWPSSNKMKGLQDRHMYYCMWDLLTQLRSKDVDGVESVLRNACYEKYESLYNFDLHNKHSSNIRSKLQDICVILDNQPDLLSCRLEKVPSNQCNVDVLKVSMSQSIMGHLHSLNLYLWRPETFRTKYDESLPFLSQEKKIINGWLLPRLQDKAVEMSVYPKDDTIRKSYNRKTCSVARDIEFRVETLMDNLKDSPELVRVTVIRNIDSNTVQFRPYIHKLITSVMQQTAGFECYCVMDLQQTSDVRCVYDLIPAGMTPHEYKVYSAFDPRSRPVSCVVIHKPKEAQIITDRVASMAPASSQGVEESESFSLYMDVDEESSLVRLPEESEVSAQLAGPSTV